VDWRPTRSPEVEAELEIDDVDQLIEAQNRRRRATGRAEVTEADIRAQVAADQAWREELRRRRAPRTSRWRASSSSGCGCRGSLLARALPEHAIRGHDAVAGAGRGARGRLASRGWWPIPTGWHARAGARCG
jgi:hypothetical protein